MAAYTAAYAGAYLVPEFMPRGAYEKKQDAIRRWRIDKAYFKMQIEQYKQKLELADLKRQYNYGRVLKPYKGPKTVVRPFKTYKPEYAY